MSICMYILYGLRPQTGSAGSSPHKPIYLSDVVGVLELASVPHKGRTSSASVGLGTRGRGVGGPSRPCAFMDCDRNARCCSFSGSRVDV